MRIENREERVERRLRDLKLAPRRLSTEEILDNYPDLDEVVAAWQVQLSENSAVHVLIDSDYPYHRAMIGITNLDQLRRPSNVYTNGTLCLLAPNESHSLEDNEDVLEELLTRTRSVTEGEPPERSRRNAEEIVDYWKGGDTERLLLIDELLPEPHEVFFARTQGLTAISDCRERLRSWMSHYRGETPTVERSALLVATLDFPTTIASAKGLYDWFASERPDQVALLESIAAGARPNIPLLIAIPEVNGGTAFLGAWIQKSRVKQIGRPSHIRGFRRGTVPGHIAAPYIFSQQANVAHAKVDRANVSWLTARGGAGTTSAITNSRVTLIGCGSLGSSVARLLVKAGVSHLRLIDPQRLEWENIARHELGAHRVGQPKAKALAIALARDFPHAEIDAVHGSWQTAFRDDPTLFDRADVFLSTTGDAASDVQLNDTAGNLIGAPTMIFSWLEPFAAAAQALVLSRGGCLRCGCDELGTFRFAATDWEQETQRYEPGCSRSWQPYSELDAAAAKAFVAATVLKTIQQDTNRSTLWTWIGSEDLRATHGGKLRDSWLASHKEYPQKSIYEDEWLPRCDGCRKAA